MGIEIQAPEQEIQQPCTCERLDGGARIINPQCPAHATMHIQQAMRDVGDPTVASAIPSEEFWYYEDVSAQRRIRCRTDSDGDVVSTGQWEMVEIYDTVDSYVMSDDQGVYCTSLECSDEDCESDPCTGRANNPLGLRCEWEWCG